MLLAKAFIIKLCIAFIVLIFLYQLKIRKSIKNSKEKNDKTWSIRDGFILGLDPVLVFVMSIISTLIRNEYPDLYYLHLNLGYWIFILLAALALCIELLFVPHDYIFGLKQGSKTYESWWKSRKKEKGN